MASFYFGKFKPHLVTNTQLYIQRKDSTVSLCPDYSANGYDLNQGTAVNQPFLATLTIQFASGDFMINNTADAFIGDSSGRIYFSGIYNTTGGLNNIILSSADTSSINHFFDVRIDTTGRLVIVTRTASGTNIDSLQGNTILSHDDYYHGWIDTDGSTWTAKLNGITQTLSVILGSNSGRFFNDVPNRDNLTIGASIRSTPLYGAAKINKVYYNNGTISALDHWKLERFFENPLNYI